MNTAALAPRPSSTALALGYAGLIPFVAGAVAVVLLPAEPQARAAQVLLAYAAAIVSFLGGIHWGAGGREGDGTALAWGVVPSLVAWVALLLAPSAGLVLSAIALALCYAVDHRRFPGYGLGAWLRLRATLSGVAALSCLVGALALRGG